MPSVSDPAAKPWDFYRPPPRFCLTVDDNMTCIFPFKYNGGIFYGCTTVDSETGDPWCPTSVDSEVKARNEIPALDLNLKARCTG